MKYSIFFLIVVQLLFLTSLQAQIEQHPSSSAMGYSKSTNFTPNLSAGEESIGIPISTISDGPLKHAVGISYQTGGIKVGEVASPIGLGWSINGGGMIHRIIKGKSDDKPEKGYFHINTNEIISGYLTDDDIDFEDINDGEPDIFSFNTGTLVGKFTLNENKQFVTIPDSQTKIEATLSETGFFDEFTITDDTGTKYFFSLREKYGFNNTGWFMERIESFDGLHFIDFEYQREGYKVYSLAPQFVLKYEDENDNLMTSNHIYTGTNYSDCFTLENKVSYTLKKVISGDQDITLNYAGDRLDQTAVAYYGDIINPQRLTSIESSDKWAECVEFVFEQDYFYDPNNYIAGWTYDEWLKNKLKLSSIQKRSCNNLVSEPPYVFDYFKNWNNEYFFANDLCTRIDYWGYFNNINTQKNLIPSSYVADKGIGFSYLSNVNRNSAFSPTLWGNLKSITYPTGGSVTYEFESNTTPKDLTNEIISSVSSNCTASQSSSIFTYTAEMEENGEVYINLAPGVGCTQYNYGLTMHVQPANTNGGPVYSTSFNCSNNNTCSMTFDADVMNLVVGTTYYFEINVFAGDVDLVFSYTGGYSEINAGGLRIANKTIHDGIDSSIDQVYTYQYGDEIVPSTGKLFKKREQKVAGSDIQPLLTPQALFYFMPHFEIYDFYGQHIAYEQVTVSQEGIGKTISKFNTAEEDWDMYWPPLPPQYNQSDHELISTETKTEDDVVVSSSVNSYQTDFSISLNGTSNLITIMTAPIFHDNQIEGGYRCYKHLDLKTFPPQRIHETTTTVDGVETTKNIVYFDGVHLNSCYKPRRIRTLDNDGNYRISQNHYTFNYWVDNTGSALHDGDDNPGCVQEVLIDYNMVGIPFRNDIRFDGDINDGNVAGNHIGGSTTMFKLYNKSTGLKVNCINPNTVSTSVVPRPWKTFQLNGTLQANGTLIWPPNYEPVVSFEEYHPNGLIEKYKKNNHDAFTRFYYNQYKRPYQKIVEDGDPSTPLATNDFITQYFYLGSTSLFDVVISPSGISTEYEYDDLLRLTKKIDCSGNEVSYEYGFTGGNMTTPENYVKTTLDFTNNTLYDSNYSEVDELINYEYKDGLGRTVQSVAVDQAAPNLFFSADLINHASYDKFGRITRTYKQFGRPITNQGSYALVPSNIKYSETEYESSPLSRTTNINPPGTLDGSNISFSNNNSTDLVINWEISGTSYFSTNSLYKFVSEDGNGDKAISFKNKLGQMVLSRVESENGSNRSDTYHLYDKLGRSIMILPPGTNPTKEELIYEYQYYKDGNLHKKKTPGKAWVVYRYNKKNELSLVQDGNDKALNRWMVINNDEFGRVVSTGFTYNNYPNESFLTVDITASNLLSETEFDDNHNQGKHLAKWSSTRLLDTDDLVYSFYDYDACNKLLKINSSHHLNLPSNPFSNEYSYVEEYQYDEMGNSTKTNYEITLEDGKFYGLEEINYYGKAGRNTKYKYRTYGTGQSQGIQEHSEYSYDIEDQLIRHFLGKSQGLFLQEIDYSYTPWGSLKAINSQNLKGPEVQFGGQVSYTAGQELDDYDLFFMQLYYDDEFKPVGLPVSGVGDGLENGNISAMRWQTRGRKEFAYQYDYDFKGQLVQADFHEQNMNNNNFTQNDYFSTAYTYGVRGRRETTSRNTNGPTGMSQWDDQFIFNYVNDSPHYSNIVKEHNYTKPNTPQTTSTKVINYSYDANGNIIDKGGLELKYNYLNNIVEVPKHIDSPQVLRFSFDANGNRYKHGEYATHVNDLAVFEVHNIGPFELRQPFPNAAVEMKKVYLKDGFVDDLNTNPEAHYVITDHLGNTRVTYSDKNNDGKINAPNEVNEYNYHPYGKLISFFTNPNYFSSYRAAFNGIERFETLDLDLSYAFYRSYDNDIGTWMQVDPKAEALKSMSVYTSMGNNPISNSDPNGDFFTGVEVAANVGGVLINAATGGYRNNGGRFALDLALSVVNGLIAEANPLDWNMGAGGVSAGVSLTFQGGSDGVGIGIEAGASVGFGKFRIAQAYVGVNLYSNNYGTNHIGGNIHFGIGIGFGVETGTNEIAGGFIRSTQFIDFAGETSQRVGGIHYSGKNGLKVSYENDGKPFGEIGIGDNGDSFRTASISVGYKDWSVNVNLFTGYRNFGVPKGGSEPNYPHGVVPNAEANKYREGILTFGYKNLRAGWNSEGIRHAVQNQFAHGIATQQNYFRFLGGMPNRPVLGADHGSRYHNW